LSEIRKRAKDHFPSVLLTFLSIIQALAVELWWSSMRESDYLWNGGWDAWVGWAQCLAVLLGILEIWLVYTSLVMRFIWLPGFQDSVFPFVIGIIEFSMVELMGPEHIPAWMCLIGLIFVLMVGSNHQTFVKARREPENADHFRTVRPATTDDFIAPALTIASIFAMALMLQITGNQTWLAFGCIALCSGILAYQVEDSRRFWNKSMG
jgi:hypothetical protein